MKQLLISGLTLAMLSAPAATWAHQSNADVPNEKMSDRSHMMQMHEHMGKTEELMEQIKSNNEPDQHQKLMNEHMQQMRMGMDMMNDSGHMMRRGKADKSEPCAHADNRMDMMDERMGMMQKMLKQMMEHQSQSDMPMHR